MKKLLLTLAIGAAVSLSASADTYYECLFGASYNSASTQDYTSSWEATNEGSTFAIVNFNNNKNGWANFVKCGRKNNASVATITTGFAASQMIDEVVLNAAFNEANVMNAIKLETSATADFATIISTVNADNTVINTKNTTASDITFKLDNPAANLYYRLTFDCKSAKANGIVWVYSVKYNGNAGQVSLEDPALAFPQEKYTITMGDAFTAPELTKATNAAITYSSDKETVATVDATTGAVTIVGVGTARITAAAAENDEFKAGSASYLITVNKNLNDAPTFDLATTFGQGKYVIEFEGTVAKPISGTSAYGYLYTEPCLLADNKETLKADNANAFTFTPTEGGYYMQDAQGRYYYLKGTYTSFNISETIPTGDDVAAIFTVTIGADNKATIVNVGKNATMAYSIQYNSIGVYTDVTDATKYALPTLYVDKTSTGITNIEADTNAPVEYFNLQGVRVENPENGLYIRRQGNKVSKVIIK